MGGRGASSNATNYTRRQTGGIGGTSKPIDVSKIKDKSLQGVENRIRKLQHEEAFIFDKDDNLIAGVAGGSTSVGIPSDWDKIDGATVTHGHPTGQYGFGGTLSTADAVYMANTNWSEMRAAAHGKGEYNYIMRRTSKANNQGLRDQIAKDEDTLKKRIGNTYQRAFDAAVKSGKDSKKASREAAQMAAGVMDRYWTKTLPKFGFEYITRKKVYEYGR